MRNNSIIQTGKAGKAQKKAGHQAMGKKFVLLSNDDMVLGKQPSKCQELACGNVTPVTLSLNKNPYFQKQPPTDTQIRNKMNFVQKITC